MLLAMLTLFPSQAAPLLPLVGTHYGMSLRGSFLGETSLDCDRHHVYRNFEDSCCGGCRSSGTESFEDGDDNQL